ncbi:MAG: nuclear transport factor 2 family protein [Actinomycetota bacterium]
MADITTTMEPQALVDGYFRCWNATSEPDRITATRATWSEDARNVDPLTDATGHDELVAMFAGFQASYPGHSFRQRGGLDAHHGLLRWSWEMVDADGNVTLDGIDVAVLAEDGRIASLGGFFGADVPDD